MLNGVELGSGSVRIHRQDVQARVFRALGLTDEQARQRFGFFLDALSYGTPPHGGIALGLDRVVALMAGEKSIREVIAFPKTTAAQDLMAEAPSSVAAEQLDELHIGVKPFIREFGCPVCGGRWRVTFTAFGKGGALPTVSCPVSQGDSIPLGFAGGEWRAEHKHPSTGEWVQY